MSSRAAWTLGSIQPNLVLDCINGYYYSNGSEASVANPLDADPIWSISATGSRYLYDANSEPQIVGSDVVGVAHSPADGSILGAPLYMDTTNLVVHTGAIDTEQGGGFNAPGNEVWVNGGYKFAHGATVDDNFANSPLGALTAARISELVQDHRKIIEIYYPSASVPSGDYTVQFLFKQGSGTDYLQSAFGGFRAVWQLSTQSFVANYSGSEPDGHSITAVGDGTGFAHASMTGNKGSGSEYLAFAFSPDDTPWNDTLIWGYPRYNGNASNHYFIAMPSLSRNGVAHPVVPTSGATASRAADDVSFSAAAAGVLAGDYSIYCEFELPDARIGWDEPALRSVFELYYDADNLVRIFMSPTSSRIYIRVRSGGSQWNWYSTTVPADGVPYSVFLRIKDNDFAVSFNGTGWLTNTSLAKPTAPTEFQLGGHVGEPGVLMGNVRTLLVFDEALSDSDLQSPQFGASVDATAEPGAGAGSGQGFAPTVTAEQNATTAPGVGGAAGLGFAPTVSAEQSAASAPGAGSTAAQGFAPTVLAEQNATAAPGAGGATGAGFAPEVTAEANATASPPPGAGAGIGFAPTVTAEQNANVSPGVGGAAGIGFAPTVSTGAAVEPGVGGSAGVGFAPAIDTAANVTAEPGAGGAIGVGFAPTVSASATAAPNAGSASGSSEAPVVAAGSSSAPSAGLVTGGGGAPTVTADAAVEPPAGGATGLGFAPTVAAGGNISVDPGAGVAMGVGFSPTISADSNVAPGPGGAAGLGQVPEIAVGSNVSVEPGSGAAPGSGLAPAVSASVEVLPAPGVGIGQGFRPTISAGANVTVEPGNGFASGQGSAPTVDATSGVSVSPAAGGAVGTGFAPIVSTGASVTVPTGGAAGVGHRPAVDANLEVRACRARDSRDRVACVIRRDRVAVVPIFGDSIR